MRRSYETPLPGVEGSCLPRWEISGLGVGQEADFQAADFEQWFAEALRGDGCIGVDSAGEKEKEMTKIEM